MTDLEGRGDSFRTVNDPSVTAEFALNMARHYAGGQDLRLPLISPYHGDLRGLPPLLIQVGDAEILRDDAIQFTDKARAAGVDARLSVWPGLWHVWQFFSRTLPEARRAIDEIGGFVRDRLGKSD